VIDLDSVALPNMLPFAPIKAALADICAAWKERVLVAARNPHLVIVNDDAKEFELTLCGDRYVFPRGDVLVLPIDNISVEALAAHCAELLRGKLAPVLGPHATRFEVTVEESPGQGSTAIIALR
jgi:6-pyruvoyltetrahydropterin/6-carboxytetrahydropterin synthase